MDEKIIIEAKPAGIDFTLVEPGNIVSSFMIPLVLAGASRWLIGRFYLREERAYCEAVNGNFEIEQEALGYC